jgi:integrase
LAVTARKNGREIVRPLRTPHDFRRTVVRRYERAGVARSVAMKLTGHKTEPVYRRYAFVNHADLREALTKVAALHQAVRQESRKIASLDAARRRTRKVPAKSSLPDGLTAAGRSV